MTKSGFALAALTLIACAPVEPPAADGEGAVGETMSHQTSGPRVLVRSMRGGSRLITVDSVPPGAQEEARYGIRAAGGIPLHACLVGDSITLSQAASCEGLGALIGVVGYVDAATGTPLYRCVDAAAARFVSTDARCQGQGVAEGLLGFVDTATPERWATYTPITTGDGGESGGGGGGVGDGVGDGEGGVGVGGSL